MRMMFVATIAAVTVFVGSGRAAEVTPKSGDYDSELMIGYDPASRMVDGYYRSETGGGQFSCVFFFRGAMNGDSAPIQSWFPGTPNEKIGGVAKFSPSGEVSVTLKEEHGGCWNVRHFADKEAATFSLTAEHPWKSLRIIKSDRVHFFDAPEGKTPRKGYVVKGDALGVKSASRGWLEVEYVNADKVISGWIRETEFYGAQ